MFTRFSPFFALPASVVALAALWLHIALFKEHTNHAFLEGVAEASQIVLRDAHVLPKLLYYEEY
jgi:hypothetical protein